MHKMTEQEVKKLASEIELYQRKNRGNIVLFVCMTVFIAAAIVLIAIFLGNEAHNRIEYRETHAAHLAQAYDALEAKYDMDVSAICWDYVAPLPGDKRLLKGWGYDAAGVPTLYYIELPETFPNEYEISDIMLYTKEGEGAAALVPEESASERSGTASKAEANAVEYGDRHVKSK